MDSLIELLPKYLQFFYDLMAGKLNDLLRAREKDSFTSKITTKYVNRDRGTYYVTMQN